MKRTANWIVIISVAVLAFGLYLIVPERNICDPARSIAKLEAVCEIGYQGVEGKNALELLRASHRVETKSFDFGEMVQSIDGVKAPATHFWAFYVNGNLAEVGAAEYQTKGDETISWKLQKIEF